MLLAEDVGDIFGKIAPPTGTPAGGNPIAGIGRLLSVGIQLVIVVAALMTLFQLLMGAIDWINSSGEKEKLVKAQLKILNAVIGLLLVIVAFVLFTVISNQVLGGNIIQCTTDGCTLNIPHL